MISQSNFKQSHTMELLKDPCSTTNLNDLPGGTNKYSSSESRKNVKDKKNETENLLQGLVRINNKRQIELTKKLQNFTNILDTKDQKRRSSLKVNKSAWRHFSPWNQDNMREISKYKTRKAEKSSCNFHQLPFTKQNFLTVRPKDVLPGKENYKFEHFLNFSDYLKEYKIKNSCTGLTTQHRQNIEELNCLDLKGPEIPYHDLLGTVTHVPFPFKLDGISKLDNLIIQNLGRGQLLPKTGDKEKLNLKFDEKTGRNKNYNISQSIKDNSTRSFTSSDYDVDKTTKYHSHSLMTLHKSKKNQDVESLKLPAKLSLPKNSRKKSIQPRCGFLRSKSSSNIRERKEKIELRCQTTKYCQPQLINVFDWIETTTRNIEKTVKSESNLISKNKNKRPKSTYENKKSNKLIVSLCQENDVSKLLDSWKRNFKISDTQSFIQRKNSLLTNTGEKNSNLFMDFIKPVTFKSVSNVEKSFNPNIKTRPITHSGFRQKTLDNKG